jgi:mannose-6-phosphate isomerase-like protein (cupin superfamily)
MIKDTSNSNYQSNSKCLSIQVPSLSQDDLTRGLSFEEFNFSKFDKDHFPFNITRFEIAPRCGTHPDCHAVQEIWIITEGAGVLTYENKKFMVNKNDVLYFESFKTHQLINTGEEPLEGYSIWWK